VSVARGPQSPEGRALLREAYRGRRVLVTGHTGFKGAWLTLWLLALGAEVTGFALAPDTSPSLFDRWGSPSRCATTSATCATRRRARRRRRGAPDVVFHLAAQPLVRRSYDEPLETLETNVMGTAHVLEAVRAGVAALRGGRGHQRQVLREPRAALGLPRGRAHGRPRRVLHEQGRGGAGDRPRGGAASSPGAARGARRGAGLGRAGNVIGGGDWAADRIVPD
jgi:CDP-glucose 4,6-dehydratase